MIVSCLRLYFDVPEPIVRPFPIYNNEEKRNYSRSNRIIILYKVDDTVDDTSDDTVNLLYFFLIF